MSEPTPPVRTVKTHCSRMDHGGCGLLLEIQDGRIIKVKGDPDCPVSHGYICAKAVASVHRTHHPQRLTHPLIRQGPRGQGKWKRASWDEALAYAAERLGRLREECGPECVAFAQGAPKGLEHFVLIRLANVFGSPNVCGPQHVCHMPRELAGTVTCGYYPIPDYEHPTALILNWGSDLLRTNEEGVICLRLLESVKQGADLIVVDPRRTHLASIAQSHLKIRPGSDLALALGLLHIIIEEGLYDREFVEQWTVGFDELREQVRPFTPERTADQTWLSPEEILHCAWTYATSKPALIQWGNALEHTSQGFQTCRALVCLMAVTGNLEVPGGNVRPPLPPVARLGDFVKAELLPDKSRKMLNRAWSLLPNFMIVPLPMVVQAVLERKPYPIRAMFAQVTNPLITNGDARLTFEALMRLDFLCVSEIFLTPTAALADVVFPAATGFEFDDIGHYGLAQGWIVARPRLVDPPGEARSDLHILNDLAKALGHEVHFWVDPRQALDEVLAPSGLTYDQFKEKGILRGEPTYASYTQGGFKTPSGKVELVSSLLKKWGHDPLPVFSEPPQASLEYPLLATSRKNFYYFHSAGRQLPSLREKHPEPTVEIHPQAAQILGIEENEWVHIVTPKGWMEQKVRFSEAFDPRVVYLDYGWWFPEGEEEKLFDWDRSNLNILTANVPFDPALGTPHLRAFPCRLEKLGSPNKKGR